MSTQHVLVTGATGFTGRHLCERLVSAGCVVRALVRDPNRGEALRQRGVDIVVGDLRQPALLERATEGIDIVYHLAAMFRPENVSRTEMWESNVNGTQNVLDMAIKAGVQRFIHCSTVGVHGEIKGPPATELSPYDPGDLYQASKTEGERIVLRYMREDRLPIVVFRPGGIYGPHDMRFLKLFKAIKTRRFVMLGSGEVLYQLIYIDDLIDGILLCAQHLHAVGNVYILTGHKPVTLNHLVTTLAETLQVRQPRWRFPVTPVYLAGALCEWVCKPLGLPPPLYRRRVDFFRKSRAFDISKAKAELGFHPKIDLPAGIRLTAAWYGNEGLL
jgi:nucleoside-diphosphate-sugar epimerase